MTAPPSGSGSQTPPVVSWKQRYKKEVGGKIPTQSRPQSREEVRLTASRGPPPPVLHNVAIDGAVRMAARQMSGRRWTRHRGGRHLGTLAENQSQSCIHTVQRLPQRRSPANQTASQPASQPPYQNCLQHTESTHTGLTGVTVWPGFREAINNSTVPQMEM